MSTYILFIVAAEIKYTDFSGNGVLFHAALRAYPGYNAKTMTPRHGPFR